MLAHAVPSYSGGKLGTGQILSFLASLGVEERLRRYSIGQKSLLSPLPEALKHCNTRWCTLPCDRPLESGRYSMATICWVLVVGMGPLDVELRGKHWWLYVVAAVGIG